METHTHADWVNRSLAACWDGELDSIGAFSKIGYLHEKAERAEAPPPDHCAKGSSRSPDRAEAAIALGDDTNDRVAVEVIGNIAAIESAVELATSADHFELDDLLSVHRSLMDNSPTPDHGGAVREEQNWIGGARSTRAARRSSLRHTSISTIC